MHMQGKYDPRTETRDIEFQSCQKTPQLRILPFFAILRDFYDVITVLKWIEQNFSPSLMHNFILVQHILCLPIPILVVVLDIPKLPILSLNFVIYF